MSGPQKFRKQPVEVDAIQWTGRNPAAVRAFTGMHHLENGGEHFVFTTQSGHGELFVAANGVWLDIEVGEWVIRDARGFYPCKPEIFEQTYRRVSDRRLDAEVVGLVEAILESPEPLHRGVVSYRPTERRDHLVEVVVAAHLSDQQIERARIQGERR